LWEDEIMLSKSVIILCVATALSVVCFFLAVPSEFSALIFFAALLLGWFFGPKPQFAVSLGIVVGLISVWFSGWYLATHQPATVSMAFDPKSQILKITLRNEGDQSLDFYDSLSIPQRKGSFQNVPRSLCVKIFSRDGKILSNGPMDGCITVRHMESTIEPAFMPHEMSQLLPHRVITSEVKLKDLIGTMQPYSEFTKLQDFCVQFNMRLYFDSRLMFPVTRETEVTCVKNPKGMK
jgi:hypothetical protein